MVTDLSALKSSKSKEVYSYHKSSLKHSQPDVEESNQKKGGKNQGRGGRGKEAKDNSSLEETFAKREGTPRRHCKEKSVLHFI